MTYEKKTDWQFDDVVTEKDANRWEKGIDDAHKHIDDHVQDQANPHQTTAEQVGAYSKTEANDRFETPAKAQEKADHAEDNAKDYTEQSIHDIKVGGQNYFALSNVVSHNSHFVLDDIGQDYIEGTFQSGGSDSNYSLTLGIDDYELEQEYDYVFSGYIFINEEPLKKDTFPEGLNDKNEIINKEYSVNEDTGYVEFKFHVNEPFRWILHARSSTLVKGDKIRIEYPNLQKGNKSTDWTPALDDLNHIAIDSEMNKSFLTGSIFKYLGGAPNSLDGPIYILLARNDQPSRTMGMIMGARDTHSGFNNSGLYLIQASTNSIGVGDYHHRDGASVISMQNLNDGCELVKVTYNSKVYIALKVTRSTYRHYASLVFQGVSTHIKELKAVIEGISEEEPYNGGNAEPISILGANGVDIKGNAAVNTLSFDNRVGVRTDIYGNFIAPDEASDNSHWNIKTNDGKVALGVWWKSGRVQVNNGLYTTGNSYIYSNVFQHSDSEGEPLYLRPPSNSEVKITAAGTTENLRPCRAATFPAGSLATFKENIQPWEESALDLINQATIYEYELKSDVENGIHRKRQGLVIGEGYDAPVKIIDGNGVEQYLMNSWSWKAIQELSHKVDQLEKRLEELM